MKKSFIAVLVILTSGHSVECFSFNDTCDYLGHGVGDQYLCGDICLNQYQPCDCGGQRITRGWPPKYCCAPALSCTRTQGTLLNLWKDKGAKCSSGEVLSWSSPVPCKYTGRCFNDVLTSQHLSYWTLALVFLHSPDVLIIIDCLTQSFCLFSRSDSYYQCWPPGLSHGLVHGHGVILHRKGRHTVH